MNGKELQKKLNKPTTDMPRVANYMKMFDRVLLYNIAVNAMPKEALEETINIWEKTVKRGINDEAANRNEFLESSRSGRKAKYCQEPDGEDIMLNLLHQCNIAKEVIQANLKQNPVEEEGEDNEDNEYI